MIYGTFYDTDAQGRILRIGEYRSTTKAAISKGEPNKMDTEMMTDEQAFEEICKSRRIAKGGAPLTKGDYDAALDKLAKGYASGSGLSYTEAYTEVMKSQVGGMLYEAREMAPVGPMPSSVSKQDLANSGGPVYAKIERLSRDYMRDNPGTSYSVAMRMILEANPNLWAEYSAEGAQGSSPQ